MPPIVIITPNINSKSFPSADVAAPPVMPVIAFGRDAWDKSYIKMLGIFSYLTYRIFLAAP
jgi:hypothetical protein